LQILGIVSWPTWLYKVGSAIFAVEEVGPDGPVRVILIVEDRSRPEPCHLVFGKYVAARMSAAEGFKDAKWFAWRATGRLTPPPT
jgi:hypothetical protein